MFEIGIGLLFAAWFVTAYLLFAKLFRQDKRGGYEQRVTLNPPDTNRTIGAGDDRRALTAGELREHHADSGVRRRASGDEA